MTSKKLIWTATRDWLEIAERDGMAVAWESEPCEWEEIQSLAVLAEENPEDEEICASVVTKPREVDTILKPGDIVLTTGPGGDVYFFRD